MFILTIVEIKPEFWQTVVMLSQRKSCYCAFCKVERKVYTNKHLSLIDVVALVMLGILLTFVTFKGLDIFGLAIVAVLLIAGEVFAQAKWRTSMICSNCAFDPVVYIRSPEQAGLKIKAFLDKRGDSPAHLLRPPIARTGKKEVKGKNLSLKM